MSMHKSYKFILFLISLLLLSTSCAVKTPQDYENPEELFARAEQLYKKRNFEEAAKHFESFQNRFPQHPLATSAELKKCDTYFAQAEYIDAEYAYRAFKKLHPKHPKIAYATLRLGQSHFKQSNKVASRDQTETKSALIYFREVLRKYPGTPESDEALKLQNEAQKILYKKELYIGSFYLKQKKYAAALLRLEPLLENFTYPHLRSEAQFKTAKAYFKMGKKEKALAALEKIEKSNSKYYRKISRLKKTLQTK